MRYCTSSRAKAAYQDDIHHARAYLTGPKHNREMWLDDLLAAAVFRRSALEWYRRYRRALEKEVYQWPKPNCPSVTAAVRS